MKSTARDSSSDDASAIRDVAARWVVRQDRRCSAAETAEFEAWLAADPRHAAAFEQSVASWRRFRQIAAGVRRAPVTTPAVRSRRNWLAVGGLAAAIAMLAFVSYQREARRPSATAVMVDVPSAHATRRFSDGSVARLKGDAQITVAFSQSERRIRLERGEAYFTVEKDPSRPFFVEAGDVTVRAVGTAFTVRFEPHAVDVLVTEGKVQVTPPALKYPSAGGAKKEIGAEFVSAGYRAVIERDAGTQARPIVVRAVSPAEIARTLAWSDPMFDLAGATLGDLVAAFSKRSGRKIEIGDQSLAAVRIGGRYPTEDVDGFLRVLDEIYDVKSDQRADGAIVLRRSP
jgi:transmembrane sensor